MHLRALTRAIVLLDEHRRYINISQGDDDNSKSCVGEMMSSEIFKMRTTLPIKTSTATLAAKSVLWSQSRQRCGPVEPGCDVPITSYRVRFVDTCPP
jgi:hypothetical protein